MRILAVDDDPQVIDILRQSLSAEGYAVDTACNGEEGESLAEHNPYDLIILDIMLPGKNGLSVCKSLRQKGIKIPIIMLTGKQEPLDQVDGLDSGADDYLVKPFLIQILCARIRALLRRKPEVWGTQLQAGSLILDTNTRQVWNGKEEITLSAKEYAILEYLMYHPDIVVRRIELEQHIWDSSLDALSNIIDQHIKNLRAKLGAENRDLIQTIRGVGYRLRKT